MILINRQPPRHPSPLAFWRDHRFGAWIPRYRTRQQIPCPDTIAGLLASRSSPWCLVIGRKRSAQSNSPGTIIKDKPLKLTLTQLYILKNIECDELLRVNSLEAQDLDAGSREAALRCLGSTFHEQDNRSSRDGLVNRCSCFGRYQAGMEHGRHPESRGAWLKEVRGPRKWSEYLDDLNELGFWIRRVQTTHTDENAVLENMAKN